MAAGRYRITFAVPFFLTAALLHNGSPCSAQSLDTLQSGWTLTFAARQAHDEVRASSAFHQFNADLLGYLHNHPITWKVKYLAGSLDCQFAAYRHQGADLLADVVQTNRSLNPQGVAEVLKVLQSCSSQGSVVHTETPALPVNVTQASVHFESPGVRGNTKQGSGFVLPPSGHLQTDPVPVPDTILQARRHNITEPDIAKKQAESLLGGPARAVVRNSFVVVDPSGNKDRADAIALCLTRYVAPLGTEFQIRNNDDLVTAFAAESVGDVYTLARQLHGMELGQGVLAYSVFDDMSLVSYASGAGCGSMAHELVHLWMRGNFPDSPPWLEEGLASEVAVAIPTPSRFVFGWSWRDVALSNAPRPPLNDLLQMSWQELNGTGRYTSQAIQSEAAVFVRFLADQGKLLPIYDASRDGHHNADLSSVRPYSSVLEAEYGVPMAAMQAQFDRWFAAQSRNHGISAGAEEAGSGTVPKALRTCSTPEDFDALDRFEHSPFQGIAPCVRAPAQVSPTANAPSTALPHSGGEAPK